MKVQRLFILYLNHTWKNVYEDMDMNMVQGKALFIFLGDSVRSAVPAKLQTHNKFVLNG